MGRKNNKKKSSPFLRQSHDITPSLARCFHASSLPVVIVVGIVLTVIPPVISVVAGVEVCRRTPTCHPRQCVTMGEGNDALRLRETNGVRVVAVLTEMVASPAVVTVPPGGAVPNCVLGLKLAADAAAVGEWGGSG